MTSVTGENADSTCWLSFRTQIWDELTDKWVTLTAATTSAAPLDTFIKAGSYLDTLGADGVSFTTNEYILLQPFSKLTTFESAYGTLPLRMRSTVQAVNGATLQDEYNLTFVYACWADSLSITT